jgi:hypothetical protein
VSVDFRLYGSALTPFRSIGPTNLTIGSLSPSMGDSIPTVTDNLFDQGTLSANLVSVSFEPTGTESSVKNGELTFGGTDTSKFTGSITFTYVPVASSVCSIVTLCAYHDMGLAKVLSPRLFLRAISGASTSPYITALRPPSSGPLQASSIQEHPSSSSPAVRDVRRILIRL